MIEQVINNVIDDGILLMQGRPVLTDVPAGVCLQTDAESGGVFVTITAESAKAWHRLPLGQIAALGRFTSSYRTNLFFLEAKAGVQGSEIPIETQCLTIQRTDGSYTLMLPILDTPFRASLEGGEDQRCYLVAESGDPALISNSITALYIALGDDPYALMALAAEAVQRRMKSGRLRGDKPLPAFVDYLGWCTWDAFYQDLSEDKVRYGLQTFADGGVQPKFMILDDGWLSHRQFSTGEHRLTSFEANPRRFPHGLAATVSMAKDEFGVEKFMVWHTMQGYWGGVDEQSLPQYQVFAMTQVFSPGMQHYLSEKDQKAEFIAALVSPKDIYRFFADFHSFLRQQGVDGVKVDCQSALEVVARSHGGRVALMKVYHAALDGSVQANFLGEIINCMSCSNDVIFQTLNSTVTRSSTDFAPGDIQSHGKHLYFNAQSTFWMGEFVHPDWDMFQSGISTGAFHAAARAISGGPVYVSDKPESHDFDILRKLVLSDGTLLRTLLPARPTRTSLFTNPTTDDVLLTVFSVNEGSGVIGAFNCRYIEGKNTLISGSVRAADVEGLVGEDFIAYRHSTGEMTRCQRCEALPVSLPTYGYEIFTFVPIEEGVAPIGLADKYNSAGAIYASGITRAGEHEIVLRDGGDFVAWCVARPSQVLVDEVAQPVLYDEATGKLLVNIPSGEPVVVAIIP